MLAKPAADPSPARVSRVLESPGQPLDRSTRAVMEPMFRHDFGGIRVHTGRHAEDSAQAQGAAAYTLGRHIVFGAGQYRPATEAGRRLVAHELAHALQQAGGAGLAPGALPAGRPHEAAEAEADRAAGAVMSGRPAAVRPGQRILLQRQPLPGTQTPLGDKLAEGASPLLASAIGSVTVDGFPTGSAQLNARQQAEIRKTAQNIMALLRTYPASTVSVTGHTDTVGTELRNLALGTSRAQAVKAALVESGVPEEIVTTSSAGEAPPQAVPTKDETPNSRNRRAEVRFSPSKAGMSFGTGTLTFPSGEHRADPGQATPPRLFPPPLPPQPDRPETPRETAKRIFQPIPPASSARPRSGLDRINDAIDHAIQPLVRHLPPWAQDKVRDGAHAAAKAALDAPLDLALDQAHVTGAERDAIKAAVDAARKTPIP
jgi:outer membrane protein OmpA-like peptidoglycan-associated protein